MNRKEFEIFEKWREEKYKIDLEKLQNDLAHRGLAQSGIRAKEELWLKKEYEAEISRKRAEMEDYENEKKEKKRSRMIQKITNFSLIGVAVISTIISILIYSNSVRLDRPYLTIDTSQMKEQLSVQHTDPSAVLQALQESAAYPYNDFFSFTIQNVGKLPAKYRVDVSEFKQSGLSKVLSPANETGFIFPNQIIELNYDLQGILNTEGASNNEASRIISLSEGNFENASKIKVFYGYVDKQEFDFKTRIEERIIEQNCDNRPTPNMQCFSNPEWTIIEAK